MQETTPNVSSPLKSQVEEILSDFLKGCDIAYPHDIQLDHSFRDDCYANAIQRGFDMNLIAKALDVGVAIADTAYRHLDNYSTRIFIAVWTGLAVCVDDNYEAYSDGLKEFFDRFSRREPQRHPVLDYFAAVTHEFPQHWGVVSSNLIVASEIDFFTSSIIDSVIKEMEVSNALLVKALRLLQHSLKIQSSMAPHFPEFTRRLSGLSRAYGVMIFPPDLDLKTWIQALPDLIYYSDHVK